jgi:hypothetical protein
MAPLRTITTVCLRLGCGRRIRRQFGSSRLVGAAGGGVDMGDSDGAEAESEAEAEAESMSEIKYESGDAARFCSPACYELCMRQGARVVPPLAELPVLDGEKLERYSKDVSIRAIARIEARSEGATAGAVFVRSADGVVRTVTRLRAETSRIEVGRGPLPRTGGKVDIGFMATLLALGALKSLAIMREEELASPSEGQRALLS